MDYFWKPVYIELVPNSVFVVGDLFAISNTSRYIGVLFMWLCGWIIWDSQEFYLLYVETEYITILKLYRVGRLLLGCD